MKIRGQKAKPTTIVFESKEDITGFSPQNREWIEYTGILKVRTLGKKPVSLELKFVPPHPFVMNLPEEHMIRADSITAVYVKLVRFLKRWGVDFVR